MKTFWVTYTWDFDDKTCRCDAVIDEKAYNTNQGSRMEIWMEEVVQLVSE